MRLVTFNANRVGRVEGRDVIDVTPLLNAHTGAASTGLSPMRRLIAAWSELSVDVSSYGGERISLDEVVLRAPVPDPSKILAAPVNYADHQVEMSVDSHVSSLGLFLKSPASVLDPNGTVQLPYSDRRFDQEGELALVIGRPAYRLEADPLDHVFAYTGLMDITMRGGEDRSTRKSFATFTPMGPWLVTPDEFGDPEATDLVCSVNGAIRQKANTADLIWGVAQLVTYASWISPLLPGDVITTGTPSGVDELLDGDVVELHLAGLGSPLSVSVSAEGAVLSHTAGKNRGPKPPPSTRSAT